MTENYFNTTHVRGQQLATYEGKAETQRDRIYEFFRHNWHKRFSPSQVRQQLGMHGTPLTSIRRAITCLTAEGLLEKTDKQVKGQYGRPEHQWQRANAQGELKL